MQNSGRQKITAPSTAFTDDSLECHFIISLMHPVPATSIVRAEDQLKRNTDVDPLIYKTF